ncbi:MAG: transcriptional regulator, TrmB [uncultured bacterium]|nr:MAG: transcriptional regulator, TrmB [uncultured bacterium]
MLYKQLQDAGLNETEAKIYLASLELGQTSVSRIARKSGIKRTTVYLSLENLASKGLISTIKKEGNSLYYAEDPRNLERIMTERKERISKLMPELLAFTNLIDKKPEIRYFEGEEGLKEVIMDSLNYGTKEILMMFSESYLSDFGEEFFEETYRPERIKRKISSRVLMPNNEQMLNFSTNNEQSLRQAKYLPPDLFKINIQIMLYEKNKISIISYKEKFAFIIDSPEIYQSFKSIFETMWATAK